jgi:SpoVK/Ycf46/Vps4 family AAA+-type ATPase
VEVGMEDFRRALANLTPSLSQEELDKYLQLKAHYESR